MKATCKHEMLKLMTRRRPAQAAAAARRGDDKRRKNVWATHHIKRAETTDQPRKVCQLQKQTKEATADQTMKVCWLCFAFCSIRFTYPPTQSPLGLRGHPKLNSPPQRAQRGPETPATAAGVDLECVGVWGVVGGGGGMLQAASKIRHMHIVAHCHGHSLVKGETCFRFSNKLCERVCGGCLEPGGPRSGTGE